MRKTFGKRLICGLTSTVMAATLSLGNITPLNFIGASAATFNYSMPAENGKTANEQCAKIRFVDKYNNSMSVTAPDNTYYLLVHAVGAEPDDGDPYTNYYPDSDGGDHYQLIEIDANGTSWTSERFNVIETRMVAGDSDGGTEKEMVADTVSIDGTILKNNDPTKELTLADARNRNNCSVAEDIEGFRLTDGNFSEHTYAENTWEIDTHVFTATYDGETVPVSISVYDYDGTTPTALENSVRSNYYLLTTLTDNYGNKLGWDLSCIDIFGKKNLNVGVGEFTAFGAPEQKLAYNPEIHKLNTRIYRTVSPSGVLEKPEDCTNTSKALDTIPDFSFIRTDDPQDIRIKQDKISYQVKLDFESPVTIEDSENIFLLVKVAHQTTEDTYYLGKVTMNNSASGTINIENWQDANGNPAEFGTYNGNRYYYRLLKATADFNLANRNNPDKFSEFNDGDIFKGFTVSYTKEQKRISDSDNKTTVYADTITFKKVSATSDYDFKSILGNSLYFGMTADRYQQKGHTETNLAVNHGNFTGDLQSDLSGNYGGDFYIANFVKFIDHHTMVKDPEGGIDVGHETKHCRDGCTLHVDDMSRAKGNNANVAIVIDDADYMQNSVVTPMIRDMRSMSAELLSHNANAALTVLGGNEAYLDTTGFPYNATIYVDADKYADVIAKSEGLRMKISAGQTIVFNYDNTSEINLGKYDIEIYDENGDPIPEREYAAKPIDKGSADTEPLAFENSNKNNQNTWLDQVARHVVWNLASAETVSIGSTAGIVLIPNSESDTEIKDTATGWLISAGYVENSSEWHFVYNDMPGNTGILILNKTDITGKNEVAGAELTIYDENGKAVANWTSDGENVKSVWLAPGSYTLKETNKGGKFTDENTGKTYTVTDSEFKFTVEAVDGSHDCTIIPEESQNSVKDDFVDDAKDAYYVYEETVTAGADQASAKTQQKITLCDMEAVEGADVTFSKKDIANKDELAGAKLRLTNRNVDWTKVGAANSGLTAVRDADGNVIGVEWTSTGKPVKIKGLPEGRGYILTERSESTNGEVVIGGETYFVVESELRFAINEGKVIGVESPDLKREADSTSETSYYLADAGKKIITVCDAKKSVPAKIVINKYDLTGDTEIDDAQLIITGTTKDGTAVSKSWRSKPGKVWEIELEDGKYVLRETGDVVVTDDGIYDVVSSEMSFTVAGGKIIEKSSNADISENGFNEKADEGYYAVGENAADDSSYIYVCDARRTDVKLSKQNTGGEEIDGAVITLTGKDADNKAILFTKNNFDADAISDDGETITWTSGKTPTEIKGLPNGTYTMHEETAPSGYQTTTDITFKVEGGKVTVVGVNGKVVNGNTVVMTDDMNTKVVINKYDLTGNTEVSGAVLTLTDEDGNLITVDAAGAKITNPWTSVSGKSFEVSLKNGKYTLTETADDNGSEIYDEKTDKYYTVIPNALSFEVKDGKIISKDAGQTTLSNAPNRAADEEYFFVTADNQIGVCDAEIKSADIVINKYDITGSNEVAGAQLTITGEGIDWDKTAELNKGVKTVGEAGAAVTGLRWKSKAGETFNVKLRDGTYTLTETSIDKDGDTEYKVIPSSVQFVVENGKVTAVTSDHTDISSSFQTAAKDETTDSYVVGKAGSNEIFVCDAKKIDETVDIVIDKRDITGKTEVKGARLTLTNTSADTRIDWAKVVDKTSVKNTNTSIELLPGGGITWVSDGTAVTVSGLPNGAGYVLAETADGNETLIDGKYTVIPTELRFNIADGKAAVDAASNTAPTSAPANGDGYFDVSGNNIITVCNAEVTNVTLSKKDITGEKEVLNAKITITDADGEQVDEWVSDGKAHVIEGLENGTYTLTEQADGDKKIVDDEGNEYEVIKSTVTFTVKNGKVTAVKEDGKDAVSAPKTGATEGYVVADKDSNKITVCDAEKIIDTDVTLAKKDIEGKDEVLNAKITIKNAKGDVVDEWVSDGKAHVIEGLKNGTYTLTEEADSGKKIVDDEGNEYEVIKSKVTFTVKNGKVTAVKENDKDAVTKPQTDATEGYVVADKDNNKITVCDAQKIIKTDVTLSKKDITGKKEVLNAKITITDADGKTVDEWVSDGKAHVIEGLENGTYTLTEEADSGKKIVDSEGDEYDVIKSEVTFTVKNGKVTAVKENGKDAVSAPKTNATEGYVVADKDNNKITVCDAEKIINTDVTLAKKDIEGKDEVLNAKITIKNAKGDVVDEWVSDGKTHVIKGLENGTYTLTEQADGDKKIVDDEGNEYEVIKSKVTFTVKNGKVTAVKEDGKDAVSAPKTNATEGYVVADKDNNKITVCDAQKIIDTDVTLAKKDIEGKDEVLNAKITIKNAKGDTVDEWVSDGKTHVIKGLKNGTYTLTEEADDGKKIVDSEGDEYDVIKSEVTFTVKNGKVTAVKEDGKDAVSAPKTGATEGYVVADKDNNKITICDAEKIINTDVTLAKKDITGKTEVLYAKITIKNAKGDTVDEWVSDGKTHVIKGLKNGTYTLTEEADDGKKIVDSEGDEYDVIKSTVTFTVKNGKVTAVTENGKDAVSAPKTNATESYVVADKDNNKITVCDAQKIIDTDVTINKTDITGNTELPDAILTVTGVNTDWTNVKVENVKAEAVRDNSGKTIGYTWKSGDKAAVIKGLKNGTYTLTEEGEEFEHGGATYTTVTSKTTFTVKNGKLTAVMGDDVKSSANENATESYVIAGTDTNTITVCDAVKPVVITADVTVNKTDITGDKEIAGANLEITNSKIDWTDIAAANQALLPVRNGGDTIIGLSWTSGAEAVTVNGLPEGVYTLKETNAEPFEYDGATYEVIDSEITFKIDAEGKVSMTKAPKPTNENVPEQSDKGYAVISGKTITICDASRTDITLSKKDIRNEEEVLGATLIVKDSDGNTVDEWISDGSDHAIKGLTNGTYTLNETAVDAETAGAEYKIVDTTVTFTVKNGKLTSVVADNNALAASAEEGSPDGFVLADKDNNKITVCDAEKTTKVIIKKTDIAGSEELTGAVLTVKDSDGNTITGTPWTSGKDGKELVLDLTDGTYTLTETQGDDKIVDKDGNEYEVIDSTLTFKVEGGKVTEVTNTTDKTSGEGFYDVDSDTNTITVNDAKKTTKVIIKKTDIAGSEELTGAVMTVKDSDGNTITGTPWTSGKDGKELVLDLTDGTYTLTETQGDDKIVDKDGNEYEVIDSTLTFKVEGGKVTEVTNTTDKTSGEGFYDVDSDTNTITVNDAKKIVTTKVVIKKTDIAGSEELTGAVLTVKDSDGNTITGTPWTSGKDGKELELDLTDGTYTLTETQGDDKIVDTEGNEYEVIDSTLTFKVEGGKVTEVTNTTDKTSGEGFYDVDSDTNTITVNDAKKTTKVVIKKTDIAGSEELTGAVLTVKDSDGNTITGTPWTSGKDGKELVLDLTDGTYTLTETQGDDKIVDTEGNEYEVIDSTLTFKVEGGKVTEVTNTTDKTSGEGFYDVDSDTNTITVNDAKKIVTTKVVIKKADIAGSEELTGAVLTVKDSDGNTITGTPWTSGKDGKELVLDLTDGTYTLTETQGDDKIVDTEGNEYEVIDSTLTFKVEGGKVTEVTNTTSKDSGEGFYDVDSDTNTITVNDAKRVIEDSSSQPEDESSSKPDEDSSSKPDEDSSSKPDDTSSETEDDSSRNPHTGDDSNSALTSEEESSRRPHTGEDSGSGLTSGDDRSRTGETDSGSVADKNDSNSSNGSSASKADSKSGATTSTATGTGTGNPNTGARVLVNAAEFAAAVGLCFLAIKRRKNDEDDQ